MGPHRPPVVTRTTPRGSPSLATAGIVLVLGGVIFAALLAQGSIALPFFNHTVRTTPEATVPAAPSGLQPAGTRPTNTVVYRDNQQRFALYVSAAWQSQPGTVALNGKSAAATSFTPAIASSLPQLRIAILSSTLPDNQYIATVGAAINAEGGTNFTPTNGPVALSVGKYHWSRIDASTQLKSANVHVTAYYLPQGSGSVLIITEALELNNSVTEQQNFTPMLASLNLG